MKEAIVHERLEELCALLERENKDAASAVMTGVYIPGESGLIDTIERINVSMKYMIYDVEATRRENYFLRQMLDTRPPQLPGV